MIGMNTMLKSWCEVAAKNILSLRSHDNDPANLFIPFPLAPSQPSISTPLHNQSALNFPQSLIFSHHVLVTCYEPQEAKTLFPPALIRRSRCRIRVPLMHPSSNEMSSVYSSSCAIELTFGSSHLMLMACSWPDPSSIKLPNVISSPTRA
jgi:hypothetical protein